jgi:hypothetical protein
MFDYTHVMTARKEYENRAHGLAHQPHAGSPKSGSAGRIFAGAGSLLVKAGGWLQAQGGTMQAPPTSVPDTL